MTTKVHEKLIADLSTHKQMCKGYTDIQLAFIDYLRTRDVLDAMSAIEDVESHLRVLYDTISNVESERATRYLEIAPISSIELINLLTIKYSYDYSTATKVEPIDSVPYRVFTYLANKHTLSNDTFYLAYFLTRLSEGGEVDLDLLNIESTSINLASGYNWDFTIQETMDSVYLLSEVNLATLEKYNLVNVVKLIAKLSTKFNIDVKFNL